jgi:hypothetical protein
VYVGFSGDSRVCMRVLVDTVTYIRQDFLGKSRFVQAESTVVQLTSTGRTGGLQ